MMDWTSGETPADICGAIAPWLWSGSEVLCSVPKGEAHKRHGGNGWTWTDEEAAEVLHKANVFEKFGDNSLDCAGKSRRDRGF